jgi:RHS repeat-associated protein
MAGISDKALKTGYAENKYRYNKKELQNHEFSDGSGLEWYDYKHRFYDCQLGRFFVQDGLADKYVYYSPYQFAGNEVPNKIDLDGLEPANPSDSHDPRVRALFDKDVQQHVKNFNDNASGALKVTVTVGPGVGVSGGLGKTGVKLEAKGPQVSVSSDLGGKVSAEGNLASGTAKVGGPGGSLGGTVKAGNVEVADNKANFSIVKAEPTIESGNKSGTQSISSNPLNQDVGLGAKIGLIGVEIKANIGRAVSAVGDFFGAITSYISAEAHEFLTPNLGGNAGAGH